MRRAIAITLALLGCVAAAQAGDDKVRTLAGGKLKITGAVEADDPKVKVTHPEVNVTVALPAKVYKVKLKPGKYDVRIQSTDIDPVLVVQDKNGKQLAFNDDAEGEGLNSRLQFQAPKDDTYTIVAASLKGAGDFTLSIDQAGAGGDDVPDGKGKAGGMTLKGGNLTVNGMIDFNAAPKVNITVPGINREVPLPAKVHEVNLGAGRYQIDIMSEDIDPVLVIQDKNGKQLALDDDGGEGLNSRLQFQAAKAETYKIYVASLKGSGAYTLTIKSQDGGGKDGGGGAAKLHEVGERGLKINGMLSRETKAITYRVKLEGGKTYVIGMVSANQMQLDPYIILQDENGKVLAEDDDGAGDLNSRLTFRAPKTGTYQIIARSFGGVGVGEFTIEVTKQE